MGFLLIKINLCLDSTLMTTQTSYVEYGCRLVCFDGRKGTIIGNKYFDGGHKKVVMLLKYKRRSRSLCLCTVRPRLTLTGNRQQVNDCCRLWWWLENLVALIGAPAVVAHCHHTAKSNDHQLKFLNLSLPMPTMH